MTKKTETPPQAATKVTDLTISLRHYVEALETVQEATKRDIDYIRKVCQQYNTHKQIFGRALEKGKEVDPALIVDLDQKIHTAGQSIIDLCAIERIHAYRLQEARKELAEPEVPAAFGADDH